MASGIFSSVGARQAGCRREVLVFRQAVLLICSLGCDRAVAPERPVAELRSGNTPLEAPKAASGVAVRASCRGLGPSACERAPGTAAALCASLAGCARDDSGDLNLDGMALDCRRDPFAGPPETAFTRSVPAPELAGVRATSIVNVVASEDDAMQFAASYLVAELPEGLCVVDRVLPWGGSHSDTAFSTHWESPLEHPRLHIQAHRTVYTVLDQEELARGESNVLSEVCAELTLDVLAGHFTLAERNEKAGACPASP